MRLAQLCMVVPLSQFVHALTLMQLYERTYADHLAAFAHRFGPSVLTALQRAEPAPVLMLGAPSKTFRSLAARILIPPDQTNYALMKAEMKWTTGGMYRDLLGPLHPTRVMEQDLGVLREHQRRFTRIAEHFDEHRAGMEATKAFTITGPAAALNDHEAVPSYEAVLDNMELLLRDAVELHELRALG